MVRKGKSGSKTALGKPSLNISKKDKNVFKASDIKAKKKPKAVQEKLKKELKDVKTTREKVDANLKELHKDMVVKNPKGATTSSSMKSTKKAVGSTKAVSQKLETMQVSSAQPGQQQKQ